METKSRDNADLLAEIRDCKEVILLGMPVDQLDANEPRYKVVISGPQRLLTTLMDVLTVKTKLTKLTGSFARQGGLTRCKSR